MQIYQKDIDLAVKAGIISTDEAKQLWSFWQTKTEHVPQFQLAHVLYYFGGLLAIGAITLFVNQAWDTLRGAPLLLMSICFFLLGLYLTRYFLNRTLRIPAGIMATFSLATVPLAVYNLQIIFGLLPNAALQYQDYHYWVNWYWVPMEISTLVVAAIMLYFYRFPFLVFPVAVTLWYMSMDMGALLFRASSFAWRATFSLYFGLAVILFAVYVDLKNEDEDKDYAYWLYIFGAITFWGGLSIQDSNSELNKLIYCLINFLMVLVSVFLNRRIFAILGGIGIIGYLGHLSFTLFANSIGFPLVLIFLGILIIFAAMGWSRVERRLIGYLRPWIPKKIVRRM